MGRRSCSVEGLVSIREGIEQSRIEEVFNEFRNKVGGATNVFSYESGTLEFEVGFSGFGGANNQEVGELALALNGLVEGGGTIYLIDSDAGDADIVEVPYFIGETYEIRRDQKMDYGIGLLEQHLAPELGSQFERVREAIKKTVDEIRAEVRLKKSGPSM